MKRRLVSLSTQRAFAKDLVRGIGLASCSSVPRRFSLARCLEELSVAYWLFFVIWWQIHFRFFDTWLNRTLLRGFHWPLNRLRRFPYSNRISTASLLSTIYLVTHWNEFRQWLSVYARGNPEKSLLDQRPLSRSLALHLTLPFPLSDLSSSTLVFWCYSSI